MTIKAYVFDAYGTLFDVHSVTKRAEELFPGKGKEISQNWRKKQVEYFMLYQLTESYQDFYHVTRNSLKFTLNNLHLDCNDHTLDSLMQAYFELEIYPEVRSTLSKLKEKGTKQTIFSNGTHEMLTPLVKKRELTELLDVLSVDDIKQYKPSPAAYKYALDHLKMKREEILFLSSNFWDITGAASFGFQTAWINRSNLQKDELGIRPDYELKDLTEIL